MLTAQGSVPEPHKKSTKVPIDASGIHDDSELDTGAEDDSGVQAVSEDEDGEGAQEGDDNDDDLAIQDEKKLGKIFSEEVRQYSVMFA